jgi:glycosyltransferase involved in cell wall biosynthesis
VRSTERPEAPAISFIVPVRDDRVRLERLLRSIRAAEARAAAAIEIIVVDHGSTDDSAAVAKEAGAVVERMPRGTVAGLRNHAAARASGRLLAFVDADHTLDPGWIEAALETFGDPAAAAAGADYVSPAQATSVQRAYDRLRRHPPGRVEVDWLGSGNLIMRREVFHAIGGFDASLQTCEDVDICRRVRERGLNLVSDERLRSIHWGDPATLRAVFFGELWRGRNNLRVTWRGGWRDCLAPSVLMPIANLVALMLLVVSVVPGVSGWLAVAGAAILVATLTLRIAVLARRRPLAPGDLGAIVGVAAGYELARALSLLGVGGHRARRVSGRRSRPVPEG